MRLIYKNSKILYFKNIIKLNKSTYIKNFQIILENYDKRNKKAILINTALSSSHHVFGVYLNNLKNIGWWNILEDILLKIKTRKICISNIGTNFGATNFSNTNPINDKKNKIKFLNIKISDWVNIQKLSLNKIKIKKLFLLIGGSLGGIQTILWNISFLYKVNYCIVISSTSKMSLKNIIDNKINKLSLTNNYIFLKNKYYNYKIKNKNGLKLSRIIGHNNYLSKDDLKKKLKINLYKRNYKIYKKKFKLSRYLNYQSNKFSNIFKIESYLFIINMINKFKIKRNKNFKNINYKNYLIIDFKYDDRFDKNFSFKIFKLLIKNNNNVNRISINIKSGHDSFLIENKYYLNILKNYIYKLNYRSDRI